MYPNCFIFISNLIHTVIQNHVLAHHEDLDLAHVLDTHDPENIPDQDLEVLTTREGKFVKSL